MKINPIGHLVKTNPIKPNFRKAKMNEKIRKTTSFCLDNGYGYI